MKNKLIVIIVAILLVSSFLIGICAKSKTVKSNELVFQTLQMRDFSDYINKIINDFEKDNPEIKIKWVDVPFSEGEKRTLASILGNNPPDLINLNPDFSALLAEKKTLNEFTDNELSQFQPQIVKSLKIEGKNYLIPWYATSAVTFYNKKMTNNLNITPPKTYDELFKICKNYNNSSSRLIAMPLTDGDYSLKMLSKAGFNPTDINNFPQADKFLDNLKSAYDNGCIDKESISMNHREGLEKFMAGKIVILEGGANFLNIIKENAPETFKNTDVAPQITNSGYNFSVMNFVIPVKSKKRDKALKFALYLTNEENQLELAKRTNIIATNTQTLKNEFYTSTNSDDIFQKARAISTKQLNNVQPNPFFKNRKDIVTSINNMIQKRLLN